MIDKTISERMKRYESRRKEQGLARVRVWVPKSDADFLKEIAEALRCGKSVVIHDVTSNPDAGTSEKD